MYLSRYLTVNYERLQESCHACYLQGGVFLSFLSVVPVHVAQAAEKKITEEYMPYVMTHAALEGGTLAIKRIGETIGPIQ